MTEYPRSFGVPFSPLKKDDVPQPREESMHIPIEKEEGVFELQGMDADSYKRFVEAINGREVAQQFETVCAVARDVEEAGGRAFLVGGCVRDEIMGTASKDFDLEIFGLSADEIERIAKKHGPLNIVGKAFGVLKLGEEYADDYEGEKTEPIDISMPRYDSKTGEGKRGFGGVDPHMSMKTATKRRDFTCNALLKDPLTDVVYDPWGGVEDLRTRTLRVTDPELFQDDSLRVMRAAQFVGRFGMHVDPDSMKLMQEMVPTLKEMPPERMGEEWRKLLLKSLKPSMGLHALRQIGVMDEYYPELSSLELVEQPKEIHPEGDAWVHTLLAVDSAADIVRYERLSGTSAEVVMWSALCHEMGQTSEGKRDPELTTRTFLEKMRVSNKLTDAIVACVRSHTQPAQLYAQEADGVSTIDGSIRILAKDIHPATIEQLCAVAEADALGRGPFFDPEHADQMLLPHPFAAGEWLKKRARQLGVLRDKPQPVLQGRDLMALGHKPDKNTARYFGIMLKLAERVHNEIGWSREDIIAHIKRHGSLDEAITTLKQQWGW